MMIYAIDKNKNKVFKKLQEKLGAITFEAKAAVI